MKCGYNGDNAKKMKGKDIFHNNSALKGNDATY